MAARQSNAGDQGFYVGGPERTTIQATAIASLLVVAEELEHKGHPECAEIAWKQLIATSDGNMNTVGTAVLRLGQLYLKTDRLDEAENTLNNAKQIFKKPDFVGHEPTESDLMTTRECLGKLWEMRGDFDRALHERFSDGMTGCCPNVLCNAKVTIHSSGMATTICDICRCIAYCSDHCRTADMGRHNRYCRPQAAESSEMQL